MDSLLSGRQQQQQEEEDQLDVCSMFPSLSYQERFGGCILCMVLGYMLSFGSFFRFRDLVRGNPTPFVMYATLGNIISLSGSCFLSGPQAQVQKMFHETRVIATLLYISSLVITILVASFTSADHFKGQPFILLVLLLCQYIAVGWYCLSYIPFARRMVMRLWNRLWTQFEELD